MSYQGTSVFVLGFPGAVAREVARQIVADGRRALVLCPPMARRAGTAFAQRVGDGLRIVEGEVERIDFGLSGRRYSELAAELDAIMYLTTPTAPGTGDAEQSRTAAREVIELGLAAPSLEHLIVLSHLDVAGSHAGSFAERDLELGQRFKGTGGEDRFRAERIYRRFMKELPITVARSGWIVGPADERLCPLVELLLAEVEESLKDDGLRLPLSELGQLVEVLCGLLPHPPASGGRFLHLAGARTQPATALASRVREVAGQIVPAGLDLTAGARRALARAEGGWSRKHFLRHQPRAVRYESAYSTGFLAQHGLPLPELAADELATLVEHAVEQIAGFR